jgi:putative ABC transport system permease protein
MMFWRIEWRLLRASRARLAVALLAVASGAAVAAALLNLQFDAQRKLTREFRAFGANLVLSAPQDSATSASSAPSLDESILSRIPANFEGQPVAAVPFLHFIATAEAAHDTSHESAPAPAKLIVVGTRLADLSRVAPGWRIEPTPLNPSPQSPRCLVGTKVASQLGGASESSLQLRVDDRDQICRVEGILSAGGSEDSQVFLDLEAAQRLAALPGRVSIMELSVPSTSAGIERFVSELSAALPAAQVRPIRQLTEAEGRLYSRIRSLLVATVALVLVLTILCVMAAMTTLAMERKLDVGLMKVLGGTIRRVLRLFLVEAGALGFAGGLLGGTTGVLLSAWLGRRVFGVAATLRWEILPLTVALMIAVAVAGAFPLRLLAEVRPAAIFRGEA